MMSGTIQRKTIRSNPTLLTTSMVSRSTTMRRSTRQSSWTPLSKKRRRASIIRTHGRRCETFKLQGVLPQQWVLLHRLASRLERDADKGKAEVKASRLKQYTALPATMGRYSSVFGKKVDESDRLVSALLKMPTFCES